VHARVMPYNGEEKIPLAAQESGAQEQKEFAKGRGKRRRRQKAGGAMGYAMPADLGAEGPELRKRTAAASLRPTRQQRKKPAAAYHETVQPQRECRSTSKSTTAQAMRASGKDEGGWQVG